MKGKVLIVEDEPIVALDLKQEVEDLGCEVIGVAESADEALVAAGTCRPDLALMDIRIVGSMDGIQTARVLRNWYQLPAIFLTSYSDEMTIARAAREMPYGYLTKPFQSAELNATLRVALHKAKMDAKQRVRNQEVATTIGGMHEAVIALSREGRVRFMNSAAEALTGWKLAKAVGKQLGEIVHMRNPETTPMSLWNQCTELSTLEGFGWKLEPESGKAVFVDFNFAPLIDNDGEDRGYILSLRDASGRMRIQAIEELQEQMPSFDRAPVGMLQLDSEGHILRVNEALLKDSGVRADSLVGRTLTGLSLDPTLPPEFLHRLLADDSVVAAVRAHRPN